MQTLDPKSASPELCPRPASMERPEIDHEAEAARMVAFLTTAFRTHAHINNVMTHIASGRWDRVEQALGTIISPEASVASLTPLGRNIVELLWAEGGTTGRIMKPLFIDLCRRAVPAPSAERWIDHVAALCAGK
jgi:hypothetical protein